LNKMILSFKGASSNIEKKWLAIKIKSYQFVGGWFSKNSALKKEP